MRLPGRDRGFLVVWLALTIAGGFALPRMELSRLREAFETDARIAHRLLSQRVVQHDAVLASLALLQRAGSGAGAEQRLPALYPQILSVQRRAPDAAWSDPALAAAEAPSGAARRPALADVDFAAGRYRVVLATQPASFAATFDVRQVVPWAEWPTDPQASPARVALAHAGQRFVLQRGVQRGPWSFSFCKHLAAESQPFDLVAQRGVG